METLLSLYSIHERFFLIPTATAENISSTFSTALGENPGDGSLFDNIPLAG